MSDSIVQLRCLAQRDPAEVLMVQALEHDRETFLAVHTPFQRLKITRGEDHFNEPTEMGVLHALQAWPKDRSALFVVRGAPGCGKSHLIKWLHLSFDDAQVRPLFISRRDSSLRAVLSQLLDHFEGMGDKFGSLRSRVKEWTIGLTEQGQAVRLLYELAFGLEPGAIKESTLASKDALICQELSLASLFREQRIQDTLREPDGFVPRIMRRLLGGDEQIDEGFIARFEDADLAKILRLARNAMSPASESTRDRLRKDPILASEVRRIVSSQVNPAVQRLMKISSSDLGDVFKSLRRMLHPQRLILFIEDVSVFQGVDEQLLEAIRPDDEGRGMAEGPPLAPIVAVIGITDGYYADTIVPKGNYVGRITHEVCLTVDDQPHGTPFLDNEDAVAAFAAKYLNALRTPRTVFEKWMQTPRSKRRTSAPSACESCTERGRCHGAFGAIDDVGLYPFNKGALWRTFQALSRDGRGKRPSPRAMLAFLRHAQTFVDQIGTGSYPPRNLLTETLINRASLPSASGAARAILQSKHPTHAEQLTTLVQVWGDGTEMNREEVGRRTLLGVDEVIYEVFGLPSPRAAKQPSPGDRPAPAPSNPVPNLPAGDGRSGGAQPTSTNPVAPPVPLQPPPVDDPVPKDLEDWGERRGTLQFARAHRTRLFKLVERTISWEDVDVPRWIGEQLLREDQLGFAGSELGRGIPPVLVAQSAEHARALEQLYFLSEHPERCTDTAFAVRAIASLLGSTRLLALEHVQAAMPRLPDGTLWNPAITALELLYILRIAEGRAIWIYVDRPAELLAELLKEESSAVTGCDATTEWSALRSHFADVQPSGQSLAKLLVATAKKWLQRTTGSEDAQYYSTGDAIVAITDFAKSMAHGPVPPSDLLHAGLPPQLRTVAESVLRVSVLLKAAIDADRAKCKLLIELLTTEDIDGSPQAVGEACTELARAVETEFPTEFGQARNTFEQRLFAVKQAFGDEQPDQKWLDEQLVGLRDMVSAESATQLVEQRLTVSLSRLDAIRTMLDAARTLCAQANDLLSRLGDEGDDPLAPAIAITRATLSEVNSAAGATQ